MTYSNQTKYGDYLLSVQASRFHYCSPRYDDPAREGYDNEGNYSGYSELEIAIVPVNREDGNFYHPSEVGLDARFDEWFEPHDRGDSEYGLRNPVAAYVPADVIDQIHAAFAEKEGIVEAEYRELFDELYPSSDKPLALTEG